MKKDIEEKIQKKVIDASNSQIKKELSFHQEMIDIWTQKHKQNKKRNPKNQQITDLAEL